MRSQPLLWTINVTLLLLPVYKWIIRLLDIQYVVSREENVFSVLVVITAVFAVVLCVQRVNDI